jgi:hypothetical protein
MPPGPAEKPPEFKRFEDAMKRIIRVPKADVDKAVKEFHEAHKRKKKPKKRG